MTHEKHAKRDYKSGFKQATTVEPNVYLSRTGAYFVQWNIDGRVFASPFVQTIELAREIREKLSTLYPRQKPGRKARADWTADEAVASIVARVEKQRDRTP